MPPQLANSDEKLLALAWQCFESNPRINYEKLAVLGGYKNSGSAASRFAQAKRRVCSERAVAVAAAGRVEARGPVRKKAKKRGGASSSSLSGRGRVLGERGRQGRVRCADEEEGVERIMIKEEEKEGGETDGEATREDADADTDGCRLLSQEVRSYPLKEGFPIEGGVQGEVDESGEEDEELEAALALDNFTATVKKGRGEEM